METITKFQFDTAFDDGDLVEETVECAEEEPPEPMFGVAELAAAGEEGFAKGREAGLAQATRAIENTLAQALSAIADKMTELGAAQADAWTACRDHALAVSVAITRKTVSASMQETAIENIEKMIAETLPRLVEEPRVVIRVGDEILDLLKERIQKIAADVAFAGQVILLAEPGLTGPDCHIEWADGGTEYNTERLWQEVENAVRGYLDGGQHRPEPAANPPARTTGPAPEASGPQLNNSPQETNHG
jgi:flagellar assembly protein FliH